MARAGGSSVDKAAFGLLLRQYRDLAGLDQARLAEKAGLSVPAISNLERGVNQPRLETVRLLADALMLTAEQRAALLQAARPSSTPSGPPQAQPAVAKPRHNLPAQSTSLLGREQDLALSQERLQDQGVRLLTLIGVAGIGKTRLALALGMALFDQYPDGVWLVELAPLADPDFVLGTLAAVLGVREEPNRSLRQMLLDHLKDKVMLLVLDNCEHVLAACAGIVSSVLRDCPGVRILSTSREALDVRGEHIYRVPPLRVPDTRALPPLEEVAAYPAVSLFLARARAHRQEFALTSATAPSVAEICRTLDGIPLAIELAAARVASLSLTAITERLDQRFRLLTAGPRDALPRQQSLQAALDWSWGLLSRDEQALLGHVAVFAGGWTLEAAESINPQDSSRDWAPLHLLHGLVGKSLVELDEGTGRYRLLETVRQYGLERLAETGELTVVRARHVNWCRELAEQAKPALTGFDQQVWAARLETEMDNIRTALSWSLLEEGDPFGGLRLTSSLWRFWAMRGYLREGRWWLDQALTLNPSAPAAARLNTLAGGGFLAYRHGDYDRAGALFRESMGLARELGDQENIGRALTGVGLVAWSLGDYGPATRAFEESLAVRRALGDDLGSAIALLNLGNVAKSEGDYGRAQALYEEALTRQRQIGDTFTLAMTVDNLGNVVELLGDYERAIGLHRESLVLRQELGDTTGIAQSLGNLGMAHFLSGEVEQATSLLLECLALFRDLGDVQGLTLALKDLGLFAAQGGDLDEAVAFYTESLESARRLANKQTTASVLLDFARARRFQGDVEEAMLLHHEGLGLAWEIGDRGLIATGLEGVAGTVARLGEAPRAACLFGAADHLRKSLDMAMSSAERREHDLLIEAIRGDLGEAAFVAAWAQGRGMTMEEAVTRALDVLSEAMKGSGATHG